MPSAVRSLFLLLALGPIGCGDASQLEIGELFVLEGEAPVAPPGRGPGDRLVLATRAPPGRVATFSADTGAPLDPPFDAFPASHAPVGIGRRLALVTPAGRVATYELNGTRAGLGPTLGRTGPLVPGPTDSLRLVTPAAELLALDAEAEVLFRQRLRGPGLGAPAVAPGGECFVSTDSGHLQGFDANGAPTFDVALPAPLTPPARLPSGRIAVATATDIQVFDPGGDALFSAMAPGLTGVVALPGGGVAGWGVDGTLIRLDAEGRVRFRVRITEATHAPVGLPEDRVGWVGDDGVARTIGPEGAVVAERALSGPPTGAPLRGERSTAYVPLGARVVALDFALAL